MSRINIGKWVIAFICLCGLYSCVHSSTTIDESLIDESSILITRGSIEDGILTVYVDVKADGLKGYDTILPDKGVGFTRIHEMGYTLFYEVYDPQGKMVDKGLQDIYQYPHPSFKRKALNISHPQWWSEENPVCYTLVLRLKIVNRPLGAIAKEFQLLKDSTDTTP